MNAPASPHESTTLVTLTESQLDTIKSDAVFDAEWDASELKKAAEAERRKKLNPRKSSLQAHIDAIDQKIQDWDGEVCIPGSGEPAGHDTRALWAAIRGFEKLHRGRRGGEVTRWFADWVKNRLLAEINTRD